MTQEDNKDKETQAGQDGGQSGRQTPTLANVMRTGPDPEAGDQEGPDQGRKGDRSSRGTDAGLQDLLVTVRVVLSDAPGSDVHHPGPQPPPVLLRDSAPQQPFELQRSAQVLVGPGGQVGRPALQQGEATFQSGSAGWGGERRLTCSRWCERISRAWIWASSFSSSTS